jgi:ABC-type transport system involved in multi-copper enzyme maturation permease subunit
MQRSTIASRELLVASRRKSTYYVRLLGAGIALATTGLMLLQSNAQRSFNINGQHIFRSLSGLCFVYCVIGSVYYIADSLSSEKRNGTLGLLFLTDLKSIDVVLGKLVSHSLNLLYVVFGLIPFLSISLLLGGVTLGECGRMALVLINTTWLGLSVSLWVSARNHDSRKSLWIAFVIVAVLCCLGYILDLFIGGRPLQPLTGLSFLSSLFPFILSFQDQYSLNPSNFWIACGAIHSIGWIFFLSTCFILIPHWRKYSNSSEYSTSPTKAKKLTKTHSFILGAPRLLLSKNPIEWFLSRNTRPLIWFFFLLIGLVVTVLMVNYALQHGSQSRAFSGVYLFSNYVSRGINLILMLLVASQACRFFADARNSGNLELLLTTPLDQQTIIQGQRRICKKLMVYALIWIVMTKAPILCSLIISLPPGNSSANQVWSMQIFSTVSSVILPITTIYALSWFGLLMGLRSKKPSHATLKTIVFVYIAPTFLLPFILLPLTLIFALIQKPTSFPLIYVGINLLPFLVFNLLVAYCTKRILEQDLRILAQAAPTPLRIAMKQILQYILEIPQQGLKFIRKPDFGLLRNSNSH